MGAGSQGFGSPATAFPGHKQGDGWEVELLGHEPVLIWDPGVFKARTLKSLGYHAWPGLGKLWSGLGLGCVEG